jgi:hypothetical protein
MNPNRKAVSRHDQIDRARIIARSLGVYQAARYLALRNWSIDAALWILTRRG